MSDDGWNEFWLGPTGATGASGPAFLGITGAVTGPAFFGVTGASGPTAGTVVPVESHTGYLYKRARIELVGASDAMIRMAMYDVFVEFFNDSKVWIEQIPGLLLPGVVLYQLVPGQPQSLGDPMPAGKIISLAGVIDLNGIFITASMPQINTLQIQYPQSVTTPVFAVVVKSVDRPQDPDLPDIPQSIMDKYEPGLLAGIKGKLMLQSNRPYTDIKNGTLQWQTFRQWVNIARVAAMRQNTNGSQAWAYPQNFRTRSQQGWVVSTGQWWNL
jgi:hypothetical protein